jgi:hypothetical protein
MDIAHHMQAMGYAGHFDLDSILDKDGKPYVVEINSRRTGGTFAHEFMATRYGENYADQLAFISQNKIHTRHPDLRSLEEAASDLLYPIAGAERGVIVALTSTLFRGDFGCIIIGEDIADVTAIQAKLFERL